MEDSGGDPTGDIGAEAPETEPKIPEVVEEPDLLGDQDTPDSSPSGSTDQTDLVSVPGTHATDNPEKPPPKEHEPVSIPAENTRPGGPPEGWTSGGPERGG